MENSDTNGEPAAHVSDYLAIIWQRKWICLFVCVVLASVGFLVVHKVLKPKYQATARIAIERMRAPVADTVGFAGEAFYQTQYQIMASSEVAALAAVKIGRSPSPESALEDGQADIVRRAVSISPERNNRVVRIGSRQGDPQVAAEIVNALVDAYRDFAQSRETALANKRQKELQTQIMSLKLEMENKKRALDEFSKDKNLQEQRQQEMYITKQLAALSEAQITGQVRREQSEGQYADLKSKYDAGENLVENFVSAYAEGINAKVRELEDQKRLMEIRKKARALEIDPEYTLLLEQIDHYQREYVDARETALQEANDATLRRAEQVMEEAVKFEKMVDQQMMDLRTTHAKLVEGLTALGRYNELAKELANVQGWHDNLQQTLLTAKISDNFPVLDIQILDRAKAPSTPAWPNKTQLSVVVAVLSVLIATALAFFLDYMDRSVHRPEDVEQELRIPFMGFVPSMSGGSGNSGHQARMILTDPSSGPAESYRKIRAKLNVYKSESHAKVFAITSTTSGEGKSTLASNLAIAFAQSGVKTLLIDADMRHPSLHKVYDVSRTSGLGDCLDGQATLSGVVHREVVENLDLVTAGTGGTNSAELLENPRLGVLIGEARECYEVIIMDSPPVLGVADATIICHAADATIFVIQAARNSKWLVRRARLEIKAAEANLIGAVLNRVRSQRGDYYYYHRYYPKKT